MDEELANWLTQHILPHEPALTRYIAPRTRTLGLDPQDVRQEIYVKVLQAAQKARPPAPRFFLFTVARNHLIDLGRLRRVIPIDLLQDHASSSVLVDEISPERQAGSFQELEQAIEAFDQLPDRCRQVIWMRKVQGATQREIATALNIAEATVEAHLVRGMRLLVQYLYCKDTDLEPRTSRWKLPRKWKKSKKLPPAGS